MKKTIIHPLLFALFPVFSLYVHNSNKVPFREVFGVVLFILVLAVLCWASLTRLLGDYHKAALIISIFLILFFSYGHVVGTFALISTSLGILNAVDFLHRDQFADFFWLLVWSGLFGSFSLLVVKYQKKLVLANQLLNIISVGVVTAVFVNWDYIRIKEPSNAISRYVENWTNQISNDVDIDTKLPKEEMPDIYYIIPDALGSPDVLREYYQVDVSSTVAALEDMGFFIAEKGHSNYPGTLPSLASSLNFMYLDDLERAVGTAANSTLPMEVMMKNNRLFQQLRTRGYQIVTFADDYDRTDMAGSDIYISSQRWVMNTFQKEVLSITPLPALFRVFSVKSLYDSHREHVSFVFDHLAEPRNFKGPSFVFVHVMVPHPPFVFGAHGEPVYPSRNFSFSDGVAFMADASMQEYINGYQSQVTYVLSRLLVALENIISRSSRPVVIIVQGDHGPGSNWDWLNVEDTDLRERMSIFNAYYFSDQDYSMLFEDITPVNTFRVVNNKYFGTHYEILDQYYYFSFVNSPYDFIDVTDDLLGTVTPGKQE